MKDLFTQGFHRKTLTHNSEQKQVRFIIKKGLCDSLKNINNNLLHSTLNSKQKFTHSREGWKPWVHRV